MRPGFTHRLAEKWIANTILSLLFSAVYGLAHGGFFTAISPLVAEWFAIHAHGTLFGIVVCFGTTGAAAGPLLASRLIDLGGSYRSTFLILTAFDLVACGLLLSLWPVRGLWDA